MTGSYRLIRWSNGSVIADQDFRYVLPLKGTINAYNVIVIIQDTNYAGQDTMIYPGLREKATYLAPPNYDADTQGCKCVFWNGDDAVSLQKFSFGVWTDIDIFGEIGVRPLNWLGTTDPVGGWDDTPPYADGQGNYLTKDQTLYRKYNIKNGINLEQMNQYGPDSFNSLLEYDSLPNNFFDSLGFHRCECKLLGIHENTDPFDVSLYPNPVSDNKVYISADEKIARIELLSMLGNKIGEIKTDDFSCSLILPPGMNRGIYIIRVFGSDGHSASVKLMYR
jgi:hypothetical protein